MAASPSMRHVISRVLLTSLIAALSACSAATPAPTAAPPAAGGPVSSDPAAATAPPGTPAATPGSNGSPAAAAVPVGTVPGGSSKEDAHWVQADDYFVADREFKQGWLTVNIAKMKEPPQTSEKGAREKGEALFFVIEDGRDQRSAHFYRTRPAVQADLVLGNTVICFDHNKKDGVYRGPTGKDNARPGAWWIAKITDLSDLGKGYAQLAGSYHCAPDALRAIVK